MRQIIWQMLQVQSFKYLKENHQNYEVRVFSFSRSSAVEWSVRKNANRLAVILLRQAAFSLSAWTKKLLFTWILSRRACLGHSVRWRGQERASGEREKKDMVLEYVLDSKGQKREDRLQSAHKKRGWNVEAKLETGFTSVWNPSTKIATNRLNRT